MQKRGAIDPRDDVERVPEVDSRAEAGLTAQLGQNRYDLRRHVRMSVEQLSQTAGIPALAVRSLYATLTLP